MSLSNRTRACLEAFGACLLLAVFLLIALLA